MEMEKEKLDEILENHVKWLNEEGGKRADLRKARIEGNLCGVNLRGADLSEANLHGVNLSEADLRWANLSGANLRWANLSGANLRRADLSGVNLRWADLSGANLREADLSGADLPTGFYQIVGAGSYNRCTTYDSINDQVVCGCWNDGAGNHLDSFDRRIKKIYGSKGAKPNLEFYTEYMSVVNFFKAMKEFRE